MSTRRLIVGLLQELGELPEDLAQVEDEQLAAETVSLLGEVERLRAKAVARISEMDRRKSFETAGYVSMTSWLRDKCRLTKRTAASLVSVARSLRDMPLTKEAFEAGTITLPATQLLGIAHSAHPEQYSTDEAVLVAQAANLTPGDLRRSLDYWRQAADSDHGVKAAERKRARRRLFLSETLDGMVRIDGDLDPVGGQTVLAAIRALSEPGAIDPEDHRSGPQRRADALTELCDVFMRGSAPTSGPSREISVVVDLETLVSGDGAISEMLDGTVIDPETARELACDAGVSRIIVQGPSEPLDIGRKTPVVPAAMRRALAVRDRGCTHEGCDRPPSMCDAHHIIHWADGGETSLNNLRLLCRRHHRLQHASSGRDP